MTHLPMLKGCPLPIGREFIDEEALSRWRDSEGKNGHDLAANNNTVWRLVATIDYFRALASRDPEAARFAALVEESLFHLRLDDRAKDYHNRAIAALGAANTPEQQT